MNLALSALMIVLAANSEPQVVPAVQQWQGGTGTVDLRGAAIVIAPRDEKDLRATAEVTCDDGREERSVAAASLVVRPSRGPDSAIQPEKE